MEQFDAEHEQIIHIDSMNRPCKEILWGDKYQTSGLNMNIKDDMNVTDTDITTR